MRLNMTAALAGLGAGLLGARLLKRSRTADLQGKVALVTGGSRGLGLILARDLGREGCRVAICARDTAELERARTELAISGVEALTVTCDIRDQTQVVAMVAEIERTLGPVDVLVNNAGIIQVGPLESMTVKDFEDAMGVMFWGVLFPTLAVLPSMRQHRQGWIINITSIGGKISAPHLVPYSAAKFAAVGLSEGLRAELAQDGISVTTIAPGLMRTGSHLNAFFTGRAGSEFSWFSLAATLPGVSMDAERAAAQIIRAGKRGDAEKILSTPASLAARFHGLFPGTAADLSAIVARLLPSSNGNRDLVPGHETQPEKDSRTLRFLTTLGRSAAERFNQ